MKTHIAIGGLVAAGFDATGQYLLLVSHAGRGVFSVGTWERVARDSTVVYPDGDVAVGIGPIAGEKISIKELDYDTGELRFCSPDGGTSFYYESGTLTITQPEGEPIQPPQTTTGSSAPDRV
jgi:hypothetical protein